VPTVHIYPCVPSPGRSDPPTPSTGKARDLPTNFPLCNCFPRARMVKRWHHPTHCRALHCSVWVKGWWIGPHRVVGCARVCAHSPRLPPLHTPHRDCVGHRVRHLVGGTLWTILPRSEHRLLRTTLANPEADAPALGTTTPGARTRTGSFRLGHRGGEALATAVRVRPTRVRGVTHRSPQDRPQLPE
jgi:hypothetical protein